MPSYYSKAQYTGDGATVTFSVPFPYIDKAHVSAAVDGAAAAISSWPTSGQVTLSAAPANGTNVVVKRTTPRTALVTYPTPSTLKSTDLNTEATQLLYLAQEALDGNADSVALAADGTMDALNKRIKNVGDPTAAQDASNKRWVEQYFQSLQGSSQVFGAGLVKVDTYGSGNAAAALVATANLEPTTPVGKEAAIMGFNNDAEFASYATWDSVGFYASNRLPPILLSKTGTFTATTFVPAAPLSSSELAKIKVGMYVETGHSPKFKARITAVAANLITVAGGWFAQGNASAGQVPPGSNTIFFNPITKAWASNKLVYVNADSYGDRAVVEEADCFSYKGDYNPTTGANNVGGYDSLHLGPFRGHFGFYGHGIRSFQYKAADANYASYYAEPGGASHTSFLQAGQLGNLIQLTHSNQVWFNIAAADGHVTHGASTVANTPYWDFRSSGFGNAYDVRLIAGQGANGINGKGTLDLVGTLFRFSERLSAARIDLDEVVFAQKVSTNYRTLYDVAGVSFFSAGNTTDPINYHYAEQHSFRNRANSVTLATINNTGLELALGTIGFSSVGNTSTTATAGAAAALPAVPFTYVYIRIDGVSKKIPVYNV